MLSRVNFILVFIFINRSVTYYISIVIFYFLSSLSLFCFICRIFIIILFLFIVIIASFYFGMFSSIIFQSPSPSVGPRLGPDSSSFWGPFVSNFKAKDRTKEEPNHQVQPTRPRRGPKKIHRPRPRLLPVHGPTSHGPPSCRSCMYSSPSCRFSFGSCSGPFACATCLLYRPRK